MVIITIAIAITIAITIITVSSPLNLFSVSPLGQQLDVPSILLLGSNDLNTILDPTWVRYSRSCIVFYISVQTPFCLDLAMFMFPLDSMFSSYVLL